MTDSAQTIRLTMAQAIVRNLAAQFVEIDGNRVRLCAGGFATFGHGNVTCLGESLNEFRAGLPVWRGQNEQSMAMAAVAYAKQKLRQRFMFATTSAGPGSTNMVTSAGIAHTNRLPLLLLCGDTYATRLPDPVLQQVEHYHSPAISGNDVFKSVTRYWDRIMHPAQVIQSLPAAIATMLDPADCGPAFLGLPQDVQGWAYDFPVDFFAERTHRIRRQPPDSREVADAATLLNAARAPVIIAGGGVQYARATQELMSFAEAHGVPVVETIAGRANLLFTHPLNFGPVGVTRSNSANNIMARADVVLAIGTRLQDFTTGSSTAFARHARFIGINVARCDAGKHFAVPIVGDAKLPITLLDSALGAYKAPINWTDYAVSERIAWNVHVDQNIMPLTAAGTNRPMSYAQVIGAVNELCDAKDRIVAAAGGLPAEGTANWRTKSLGSVDVEFGFSCMGYEIAGGWGARIAQAETEPGQDTIVFTGDGSYLMLNCDIYSAVLTAKKLIIIVCDNGGFAVINKLQNNTGNVSFNNLIKDCNIAVEPFAVDFVAHAQAMGAHAESVDSIAEFKHAFARAKASGNTYVISLKVDAYDGWTTEGHTWWQVGSPQVSNRIEVTRAHNENEQGRKKQRAGAVI